MKKLSVARDIGSAMTNKAKLTMAVSAAPPRTWLHGANRYHNLIIATSRAKHTAKYQGRPNDEWRTGCDCNHWGRAPY